MRLRPTFDRNEPGFWISGAAHAAMLGAAVFALAGSKLPEAQEGIPVEIFTDSQFSQITRGEREAEAPQPKPRAERVAETRQEKPPGEAERDTPSPPRRPPEMKVAEREEAAAGPPPPPPAPRVDREAEAKRQEAASAEKAAAEAARKAEAAAEAKAEAIERAEAELKAAEVRAQARRAAEAKAKAEAEAKAVAESKAKAESEARAKVKAEADARAKADSEAKKVAEAKAQAEREAKAKRQAELADRFDPGDIRQLLQSKEKNQSQGSTGAEVSRTASLGTVTGTSQKLNPNMRDAFLGLLKDQIERCYSAPVAASTGNVINPFIDLRLNPDGSLSAEPRLTRSGTSSLDRAVADAALRAVRRCSPFRFPAQFAPYHQDWKAINVEFEPPRA